MNVLLDNTSGDNKNNDVIFFLAWLVMTDVCVEASFFCMMVGHTYSEIDQTFNTLIAQLLNEAIYTVSRLCELIYKFLAPYKPNTVHELHCHWDWKKFFAPHVHQRFGGFYTNQFGSGMHEFLLRKGRDGAVRLHVRKSSAASGWIPEGEGYPVFKSPPTGSPELAIPHPEHQWGRADVEQTVHAWMRFMGTTEAENSRIRAEWQARFDALPCDNDPTQLAEAHKLKWADLPKRAESDARAPPVGERLYTAGDACCRIKHSQSTAPQSPSPFSSHAITHPRLSPPIVPQTSWRTLR